MRASHIENITIALYEPEIPTNVGNIIRTCACYNRELHVIEPVGFMWIDKSYRRAKMDYETPVTIHNSWAEFYEKHRDRRIILLTPHTSNSIIDFEFKENDILLFGRESNGVEMEIAAKCQVLLSLPMYGRTRSFNLATAVAMSLQYC